MQLLLISGSTRRNSTNAAALEGVCRAAPVGCTAVTYDDLARLPAFNPDDDTADPPPPVAALRTAIGAADAVLISTPEYAGTLPGSLKNLLDWTVGSTAFTGKPVAWLNVAAADRGRGAIATLETVLGYVGASLVSRACVTLPIGRQAVDPEGVLTDPSALERLTEIWAAFSTVSAIDDDHRDA